MAECQIQQEGWHYTIVENAVLDDLELSKEARLLYVYLSRFANSADKKCWPSIDTLAKLSGISERKVRYCLKELETREYIRKVYRREGSKNLSNLYILRYIPPKVTFDESSTQEVVHTVQEGTAPHAPEVVHTVQEGTAPHAPELKLLNYNHKELNYTPEFDFFWKGYPKKIEKIKVFKCWNTRIKDGYTPEQMITAAKKYLTSLHEGTELQYIKNPSTFIGPNKPFLDYLDGLPPEPPDGETIITDVDIELESYLARCRGDARESGS
jgi:hypothetical protein